MRTTRLIDLDFSASRLTDSFYISIPFNVREIRVKSIAYESDIKHASEKTAKFGVLTSDLTFNTPLGFYHQNSHLPMSPLQNVIYEVPNPQPINGSFLFTISEEPQAGSLDEVQLILEFLD